MSGNLWVLLGSSCFGSNLWLGSGTFAVGAIGILTLRRAGLGNKSHHDIVVQGRCHTLREGHITNVKGITNLKVGDLGGDTFRKILGKTADLEAVKLLLEQAAGMNTGSFASELQGKVGMN